MAKIKQVYKQTDIGVIPEDWATETYDEIFNFLSKASFSRAELSENGSVGYVHYGDIHTKWNHFIDLNIHYLPFISQEQAAKYSRLKDGDLIVADASEDYEGVGKSVEVKNIDNRIAISGLHTFLLRDKKETFIDGYKGYITSNKLVKKQFETLATGLKVYGISKENLKNILIPYPKNYKEQEAIATALSDIDSLIDELSKLIDKKRVIKEGAMQQLLSPKKGWKTESLGNLCELIVDGTHQTPIYVDNGIPFYSVENVTNNNFSKTKHISLDEHLLLIKRCKIAKGDILLTRIGSVGKTKLIDWDVNASIYVSLALLRINEQKINKVFLYSYTKSSLFIRDVEALSLMNAIPLKINMDNIKKIPINYPSSFEEQKQIALTLSDMDDEIETLEQNLSKYKAIKTGMMQQLLTGQIRLI